MAPGYIRPYFYNRGEIMDRIIDVKVNGDYLSMDRRKAGNQHEPPVLDHTGYFAC
jgi:hypothetical protein